ncbi:hypothetical protein HY992_06050 [Candidatus Micrarchaeota archaeon]|nr:hypothetical protein [Candidatus Micrarchaeota archaeon]
MAKKKIKALALFSGGLDSLLAVKMIKEQGIEVIGLNFSSPFCLCKGGGCASLEAGKNLGIEVKNIPKGEDYMEIVRDPPNGRGRHMNPCIDCRIYILKKAKEYAKEIGASFIFTGEVLDERPMSQHRKALDFIEEEAGLKGKLLRPLSAQLLPETEAEKKGWVDRSKLVGIQGRRRTPQFELAEKYGLKDYPCPSGGCLLTYKEFADKMRALLDFKKKEKVSVKDVNLLKVGRHFFVNGAWIAVGRNEGENERLKALKEDGDYLYEADKIGSPIALLKGEKTKEAVEEAARLTARYSDAEKGKKAKIKYGEHLENSMSVKVEAS